MNMHRRSTQTGCLVLGALLVLLAITVIVAHFSLGTWSTIVALSIAAAKAAIIGWYFMHLRDESSFIRIFSLAGVFCLLLMFMLLASDYASATGAIRVKVQ